MRTSIQAMFIARNSTAAALIFGLTACAIRPTVGNVTAPLDTALVADRIRCEMRLAVSDEINNYFANYREEAPAAADTVLSSLRRNPDNVNVLDLRGLPAVYQTALGRYANTAVVYDFSFDMTVTNNVSGNFNLGIISAPRLFGSEISARQDLARKNLRVFRLQDTFQTLFSADMKKTCDKTSIEDKLRKKNFVYPITGSLGLSEMVHTFVSLNETGRLEAKDKLKQLSDSIEFTTTREIIVNPFTTADTIPDVLRVTRISVGTTNARQDVHNVTIGIAVGPTLNSAVRNAQLAADDNIDRQNLLEVNRFRNRLLLSP